MAQAGPETVRYGGNTSCVEVRSDAGTLIVVDCGTGAHRLGQALVKGEDQPVRGHLLISHTHWDHIQGFPFFAPLFVPGNEWDVYAPRGLSQSIRDTLAGQMQYTYFPVTLEAFGATIRYHELVEGTFEIDEVTVRSRYLNHPALTLGYRFEADGVAVAYACDHEPHSRQPSLTGQETGLQDRRHADFLGGADLVIHDAQYTVAEYANKIGWGHSTADYAADICSRADVKQLALTHHDPARDDDEIDEIVAGLRAKLDAGGSSLHVFAAAEGNVVDVMPAGEESTGSEEFAANTAVVPAISSYSIFLGATDERSARVIRDAAKAENVPVVSEADTTRALRLLADDRPSLVILDDQADRDQILEICALVKEPDLDGRPQAPIIMLSDRETHPSELNELATDWLVRPFSEEFARTHIRAWILRTACRWMRAKVRPDEDARLGALDGLRLLDTEPEERFDRISRIAAATFDMPVVMVSLVDRTRQWFKSSIGLATSETHRDMAFCAHAILKTEPLVVPDAFLDPRFADNPLVVGEPRIRFYAGCPLQMPNGSPAGTFCLIDSRPREFGPEDVLRLKDFGKLVEAELAKGA